MLRALRLEQAELSVLLTNDRVLRELNRSHRGIDKPTDVLAFPMWDGGAPPVIPVLGDIAISLETARAQAVRGRRRIIDEVSFLLAHGLLHLLGLDHPTRDEERRMTARTDLLMATFRGRV